MFVIKHENGKYVADMRKSRDGKSYTKRLEEAKTFPTWEAAIRDKCEEGEFIYSLDEILGY